jgi:hypothetical protein
MEEEAWESLGGSPPEASVPEIVPVRLDTPTRFALEELTADGTTVDDAVRETIIDASARLAQQRRAAQPRTKPARAKQSPHDEMSGETETCQEKIARQVAAAPPFSACQAYVLRAAFLEGRIVRTCEPRDGRDGQPARGHRQVDECLAPDCLGDPYDASQDTTPETTDRDPERLRTLRTRRADGRVRPRRQGGDD